MRVATTTALCTVLLLVISSAQAQYDRYGPIVKNTTWEQCQDNPSYLCGTFDVPLDWTSGKESTGKATLGVVKYPATQTDRKGSLFINPGVYRLIQCSPWGTFLSLRILTLHADTFVL